MPILVLYQKKCPGLEGPALAIHESRACAGNYIQPLVSRAMTIFRATLGISGGNSHGRDLRSPVSECDAKAFAESKQPFLHFQHFPECKIALPDLKHDPCRSRLYRSGATLREWL
jgi:hypothetical protein